MANHGSSCGACRFLRRKCIHGCIFAPYFCYDEGATHFAAIHKIFGASNVSKLLSHLPVHSRSETALTIAYEAQARIRDPIYGCVAHIFALQQQVASLQEEIELLITRAGHHVAEAAGYRSPQAMNSVDDVQIFAHQDLMNLCAFNQQSLLSVAGNHAFNGEIDPQPLPLQRETMDWWDHRLFDDLENSPNSLETLCLDVDPDIVYADPRFDHAIYPEY